MQNYTGVGLFAMAISMT